MLSKCQTCLIEQLGFGTPVVWLAFFGTLIRIARVLLISLLIIFAPVFLIHDMYQKTAGGERILMKHKSTM